MNLRRTLDAQHAAVDLVQEHNLKSAGSPLVISSWVIPVPMVLHHSSKFTEFGEVTLALALFLLSRLVPLGPIVNLFVALAIAVSLSWFLFRLYYDVRYFKQTERMILLPPNANDNTLLHELLHIELGHISPMSSKRKILAISPLGPIEYGIRNFRHDYAGEGVVGELHRRVKSGKTPLFAIAGFFTFGLGALIFFGMVLSAL